MEVSAYADYLTEADLRLIAQAVGASAAAVAELAGDAAAIEGLLADPRVFSAVFGTVSPASPAPPAAPEVLVFASPFLAFGVAVHRAVADLAAMDYLPERSGLRQRVPVFDTPELRDFLGSAERRLFLAELLASFTRVASGRYRVPSRWGGSGPGAAPGPGAGSGGRSRTRRFSELDPVRLAGLLDGVPDAERPGVYRRLGDVTLFLTGVFPDYAVAHALGPVSAARLLRAAQVSPRQHEQLTAAPAIDLFEYLGARWYRVAWSLAPARTARLAVVAEVADRFRQARRVLNHIADRCLFPPGNPWFAPPAA